MHRREILPHARVQTLGSDLNCQSPDARVPRPRGRPHGPGGVPTLYSNRLTPRLTLTRTRTRTRKAYVGHVTRTVRFLRRAPRAVVQMVFFIARSAHEGYLIDFFLRSLYAREGISIGIACKTAKCFFASAGYSQLRALRNRDVKKFA